MTVRKPTWRRTRSPKLKAAHKKEARAEAREYLTGRKVMRYESPQMIAKHGRAPWPAKKAAAESYSYSMLQRRVADKYVTGPLHLHRTRKTATAGRKKTSQGGTWTLRKANVSRGKGGRFVKRRSR